jgi:hemerythrin-like domain-containing protein
MPPSPVDPVQKLEHDHIHLNRVVESLRDSVQACLRGEREPTELEDDFAEFVELVKDELFEHFEREESALFPYVAEQFPDLAPTIAGLSAAHDRICGVASRLEHVVAQGPRAFREQFETIVALFARFDANFMMHARDERDLIGSLSRRLNDEQRRLIAQMLSEL